jgi:SAM-dependent methyltransferase
MAIQAVAPAAIQRKAVACPVCKRADERAYLEARGYRIVQCRTCGLWYVNPQPTPEELREFYATYDDGEQWRKLEEHFNRAVRGAILRRKNSGKVLDVGCGSGNFLRCMKKKGFAVFGIEPSGSGSEYARSEHDIEIYHGMMDDYLAAQSGLRFDVITMLNVLEHLTDPAAALLRLRQVLAPDGMFVIVVPDARFHDLVGRLRRRMGAPDPYWLEQPKSVLSGFKLPDHLCSFQPATLAALLRLCGVRIVSLQTAPMVLNPSFKRNLGKLLINCASRGIYHLSFRRIVVGYSTLVMAQKA